MSLLCLLSCNADSRRRASSLSGWVMTVAALRHSAGCQKLVYHLVPLRDPQTCDVSANDRSENFPDWRQGFQSHINAGCGTVCSRVVTRRLAWAENCGVAKKCLNRLPPGLFFSDSILCYMNHYFSCIIFHIEYVARRYTDCSTWKDGISLFPDSMKLNVVHEFGGRTLGLRKSCTRHAVISMNKCWVVLTMNSMLCKYLVALFSVLMQIAEQQPSSVVSVFRKLRNPEDTSMNISHSAWKN